MTATKEEPFALRRRVFSHYVIVCPFCKSATLHKEVDCRGLERDAFGKVYPGLVVTHYKNFTFKDEELETTDGLARKYWQDVAESLTNDPI